MDGELTTLGSFLIKGGPVISLLESLRMRYSDLRRIVSIVVKTRVDNVNSIDLTSGNIKINIKFNVLTLRSNDLIGRRNCFVVTNTRLSDRDRIDACNNRHIESLIGILSDDPRTNDHFILSDQFMVLCGCNSSIRNVIDDFLSVLCNTRTLYRFDLCRSTETISSSIVEEQSIVNLIGYTRVLDNKSINLSILELGSSFNFDIHSGFC